VIGTDGNVIHAQYTQAAKTAVPVDLGWWHIGNQDNQSQGFRVIKADSILDRKRQQEIFWWVYSFQAFKFSNSSWHSPATLSTPTSPGHPTRPPFPWTTLAGDIKQLFESYLRSSWSCADTQDFHSRSADSPFPFFFSLLLLIQSHRRRWIREWEGKILTITHGSNIYNQEIDLLEWQSRGAAQTPIRDVPRLKTGSWRRIGGCAPWHRCRAVSFCAYWHKLTAEGITGCIDNKRRRKLGRCVYSQRESQGGGQEREGWNDKDNELDEREAKSIVDETVARCTVIYTDIFIHHIHSLFSSLWDFPSASSRSFLFFFKDFPSLRWWDMITSERWRRRKRRQQDKLGSARVVRTRQSSAG